MRGQEDENPAGISSAGFSMYRRNDSSFNWRLIFPSSGFLNGRILMNPAGEWRVGRLSLFLLKDLDSTGFDHAKTRGRKEGKYGDSKSG